MATSPKPDSLLVGHPHQATPINAIFKVSAALTPASVNAATAAEQTFNPAAFAGIQSTDTVVMVSCAPTGNATLVGQVRVSTTGTIAIQYVNPTAGALTPGAGTYTFMVIRWDA